MASRHEIVVPYKSGLIEALKHFNIEMLEVPENPVAKGGFEDADRALARDRVKDPGSKLIEREEKCDDGDTYSCGVAKRLASEVREKRSADINKALKNNARLFAE